MGKEHSSAIPISPAIKFATALFLLAGAYNLLFPALVDRTLWPLLLLGAGYLATAAAAFTRKRIALWLALLILPLSLTESIGALINSVNSAQSSLNPATVVFNVSLVSYALALVFGTLLIVDRRNELK